MSHITIAIDAMGGDFGPKVTIPASLLMLKKYSHLRLLLVGDDDLIRQEIDKCQNRSIFKRLELVHATQTVGMDELPSIALRTKKDSSMRVAISKIKDGSAEACVSAGNTGALMAIARFVLKTLPGVDRPAIITSLPTINVNKKVWMLDLGANVDSSAAHLFQFAVMGSVLASASEQIQYPKVALLNIGEEEIKGNDQVKHTAQLLSENRIINYIGYIEGNDIFSGVADVVVCDGFVGNVSLKTLEGAADLFGSYLKTAFTRNWFSKLLALASRSSFRHFKKSLDPAQHNGASFIGLRGTVVKSHGSATIEAFANAIKKAINQVENNIPELIHQEVGKRLEEAESL